MEFKEYLRGGEKTWTELKQHSKNAAAISADLLCRILKDNQNTEYGKKYNFGHIQTIADFKKQVPFSHYEDYRDHVERMKKGEKNLLTVYPIAHYAKTSGTIGTPKSIPVSAATLDIYVKYSQQMHSFVCDRYLRECGFDGLKKGDYFTTVISHLEKVESGATYGMISSATYQHMRPTIGCFWGIPDFCIYSNEDANFYFLKALFALKNRNIVCLDAPFVTALYDFFYYVSNHGEALCQTIRKGKLPDGLDDLSDRLVQDASRVLTPDEKRADELEKIFAGGHEGVAKRIWPRLAFCNCIGAAVFEPYLDKLRKYIGDLPISNSVYASSEAFIATVTAMNVTEYTIVPEAGFFEFLPVEFSEADSKKTQDLTLNLNELEVGKDYEIIITNLSGFYRYRIGDVVTVLGYEGESPKICFKRRLSQNISMAGEKTSLLCIADIVKKSEKRFGIDIRDYSIYANHEAEPGRYRLYIESAKPFSQESLPSLEEFGEKILEEDNPSYADKIKKGILIPLEIVFLQKDTYWLYRDLMQYKGIAKNQMKPVRLIDNPEKEKFFEALIEKQGSENPS